jgi:lipopolysaccharide/colanic/teichoic acid biosynthesis glycosyltransferase
VSRRIKRWIDVAGALIGLVAAAPVMLLVAAAVRASTGPVFFRQVRAGHRGRAFTLYKLRTMRDVRDAAGEQAPDGVRLTRVGRFLRSTSLDELPQLWNVLKGDMSLVGPRPLLLEYVPLYSPRQMRRHEVKPGLTTWSAVNGRNSMSWDTQLEMDVWYVEHWSLRLDLKILLLTVVKVLQRDGIAQDGHATRERFRGSPRGSAA